MSSADTVERFLAVADSAPGRPAVVIGTNIIAYDALSDRTRRIAAAVRRATSGIEHPKVLINLDQSPDAYAAIFAALMAGGFYTAVSSHTPVERQRKIVARFAPDVVVVGAGTLGDSLDLPRPAIVDVTDLAADRLEGPAPGHELAYVVFTSGSTGEPKGVMIPRAGLDHYAAWATDAMAITPDDRVSQHPNLAFDLSVLDVFGALCSGACLYPLIRDRDRLMPAQFIRRHELTIWDSVPSVVDLMMRVDQVTSENFASLRLLTFCGEPLLQSHLDAIFAARPDACVHNTYGPSEATVSCTLVRLTSGSYRDHCDGSVALGDAIAGMGLHLVGGESDDEGEIVLSGPQLALGYWQDAEATARAFRPFKADGRELHGYHTGDWAIRRNGNLFFSGRIDRQIKIRGHRLELGEVDVALRACGASNACTVFHDGVLHSFIEGGECPDVAALRRKLEEKLPSHAIPEHFHLIGTLPRNPNDKIDALALKARLTDSGASGWNLADNPRP